MYITIVKYWKLSVSILFGCLTFVFWFFFYPQALSYQEQFQLFLWTGDYLIKNLNVPGGFAGWLGELVTQFYYVPWLGALLLAGLFIAFAWIVGWLPAMLLFWLLGDPAVMLGYVIAMILTQGAFRLNKTTGKRGLIADAIIVPLLYWLTGPLALLYVLLRITKIGAWGIITIIYLLAAALLAYRYVFVQLPLEKIITPTLYYQISLETNTLMWVIPLVALAEYTVWHLKIVSEYKGKTLKQYEAELEELGLTNYNTEAVVNYKYDNNTYSFFYQKSSPICFQCLHCFKSCRTSKQFASD